VIADTEAQPQEAFGYGVLRHNPEREFDELAKLAFFAHLVDS
jgi:hypothetical protein